MTDRYFYEIHNYEQPSFPFFYHTDLLERDGREILLHWHENTEVLACLEGAGTVNAGGVRYAFSAGDLVIFNSNEMHSIRAESEQCRYYCLIISRKLCEENDIFPGRLRFPNVIQDAALYARVTEIFEGLSEKSAYRLPMAKFRILLFYAELAQRYAETIAEMRPQSGSRKEELVRSLVDYISTQSGSVSVQEACSALGFSESYVCHTFRAVTGQTVTEFINYQRCIHARQLLKSGACNVSEAALQCGFTNFSYFSKIYRALIGHLPKEDMRSDYAE